MDSKTLCCSEFIRRAILIQTEQISRIDENISVWSGDKEFVVRIFEMEFNPESYQSYNNEEFISSLSPRSGGDGGTDCPDGGEWVEKDDGTVMSSPLISKGGVNTVTAFNGEFDGKDDNTTVVLYVEKDRKMGEFEEDSDRVASSKMGEQSKDWAGGKMSIGSIGPDYVLNEVDGRQSQSSRGTCSGPRGIKSGENVARVDG